MTFNTGNPVGSTDARDLYDNAQNLDKFANGPELEYEDRLGVPRKSLAGIRQQVTDALSRLGYQIKGDYAAGLLIENYGEVFRKDGEFYRAKAELTLPYPLNGDWAVDAPKFFSVGDAVLRQELANGKSFLVDSAVVGFNGRSIEAKLGDFKIFADFGAIGDGLSHPLSERFATLAEAQTVYPFVTALTEEIDRCAIQLAVNQAADNATLLGGSQRYKIDAPVTLTDKGPLRIVGGVYDWPATFTNVFKLVGECHQPEFMFCVFLGDGVPRSTMGAIGCSSGTITNDLKISYCRFDKVPFGAYINADLSGIHYNPEVSDCTFVDPPRYLDDTSGSGLGLVFAEGGTGRIVNGVSRGNTFIRTGRHALYISNGGNVRSIGDRFLGHRDDGSPLIQEGGAIQISRNAKNVTVLCPVFEACKDTCISITSVVTDGSLTYPENIKVFNPIFKGNFGALMRLGNDSPSVNGVLSYVDIRDIEIWNQGEAAGAAISILSGTNISIDGVTVREFSGSSQLSQIIRLFGYGTVAETNKISIKNVKGTFQNSSGSAVYVDTRVCTGTALVELNNIDTSGIPINYQSAVTNTNIRQDCAPGLIRDFPRSNTDPNGVYAADPGTLFVSRAGASRSVWIKEALFGTSGWSLLKTRLVGKSTTANRPALTSSAYDIGTMYMDTTLNANGKPIWWNGAAWVDSSGAAV